MNTATRPALGEGGLPGHLYDAATDTIIPISILGEGNGPEIWQAPMEIRKTETRTSVDDSMQGKLNLFGLGLEHGASIISGCVEPKGCGAYLRQSKPSESIKQAAFMHQITTLKDALNLSAVRAWNHEAFRYNNATHLVLGMEWGLRTVVEVSREVQEEGGNEDVTTILSEAVDEIKQAVDSDRIDMISRSTRAATANLDIMTYSDIHDDDGIMMCDMGEFAEFFKVIPSYISTLNQNRGHPLVYHLLPLEAMQLIVPGFPGQFSSSKMDLFPQYLLNIAKLFGDFTAESRKLADYQLMVEKYRDFVQPGHLNQVQQLQRQLDADLASLKSQYKQTLIDVRGRRKEQQELEVMYNNFVNNDQNALRRAAAIYAKLNKAGFAGEVVAKGGKYVGYNGADMSRATQEGRKVYVLKFNEQTMQDAESWDANEDLVFDLLKEGASVVIIDCDATSTIIQDAQVALYEQGVEACPDVAAEREFLAGQCFARARPGSVEKNEQAPLKRRYVDIQCPDSQCSANGAVRWLCDKCQASLEFGFTDEFFYCECGRSHFRNFDFKCNSTTHGPGYEAYNPKTLKQRLEALPQGDDINILILGETGVGKSTFINSFVNYLAHDTLDDALTQELNWVIPCKFSTQVMNRANPERGIEEKVIVVGEEREDENVSSAGESATQKTSVWAINFGERRVRLIDTPGIGDTRGLDFDRQNMKDILQTLSNYENLHGILILLKPNNSRLTVTFEFCMKELLTHLHKSAAHNMAFGFTNTRISNFTPGDTYTPLKTLLGAHQDVGLQLSLDTTYCFDSESFRYLAAFKDGVEMENKFDFCRSWDHSAKESRRMVDYFASTKPHMVTKTVSMNQARELIAGLTKPMAEITQAIQRNMRDMEDEIEELDHCKLSGGALRAKLHVQKLCVKAVKRDMPQTVCCHSDCIEYGDDGTGNGQKITVYRKLCHDPCYLDDITADTVACPGLIHCWAFHGTGDGNCRECGHHWQNHMHFLWDLEEESVTMEDPRIKSLIESNASDEAKQAALIEDRRRTRQEYEDEYKQVQQAAARFGVFLSDNSITAYNDKTIEYLDLLIKQEKDKVGNTQGPARKKLEGLETSKREYLEFLNAVKANLHGGGRGSNRTREELQPLDQAGVTRLVEQLYNLKHFGDMLHKFRDNVVSATEATYRERPHTVKTRKVKKGGVRSPSSTIMTGQQRHGYPRQAMFRTMVSRPMPGTFVASDGMWMDGDGYPVVPHTPLGSSKSGHHGSSSSRRSRHMSSHGQGQDQGQSSTWKNIKGALW